MRPQGVRQPAQDPRAGGGEIQLTDALKTLASDTESGGGVHGVLFRGRRYDTGNKLDYLRTLVSSPPAARPGPGVRALAAEAPGIAVVTEGQVTTITMARPAT